MVEVSLGLTFPGTCEQAFNFYKSVFGVEFLGIIRLGDDPYTAANTPKAEHGSVAGVAIKLGDIVIGGADTTPSSGQKVTHGNAISIIVEPDNKAEADRYFHALAAGGKIITQITDFPWGYYGSLTDKFGISWVAWYKPPQPPK
jgi:PhnB protein